MADLFTSLPAQAPVILVLWAFCIFVIWYVHRHATSKNRARFLAIVSGVSALFFFVLAYLWWQNRIPFHPKRVIVYPLADTSRADPALRWRPLAVQDLATRGVNAGDPEAVFAYPFDWLWPALEPDSLHLKNYALNFARRIEADYAVWSAVAGNDGDAAWHVEVFEIPSQNRVAKSRFPIDGESLVAAGRRIGEWLLEELGGGSNGLSWETPWRSESQMQGYFQGKAGFWARDYEAAVRHLNSAVKADSSATVCLNFLAKVYLRISEKKKAEGQDHLAELQKAKQLLDRTLDLESDNAPALRMLGEFYAINKMWTQAEGYLRKALEANPWDSQTYYQLSFLHPARYNDLGFRNVEELLQWAAHINPAYFEAYYALAKYYHGRKNRRDSAIRIIKKVLHIRPTSIDGLMALAKYYMADRDFLNALRTYEKVLDRNPYNPDLYYNLGIAYYHMEDFANAIKFFERAIDMGDHRNAHLYLAYIYERQGKMGAAIEHLRTRIRRRTGEEDVFAEEARKHLFQLMQHRGVIDSLYSNEGDRN